MGRPRGPGIGRRAALLPALGLLLATCGPGAPGTAGGGIPAERGRSLYERAVGGLACADCHGDRALPAANPDWRPAGHPLAGAGRRPTLWAGRFRGADRVLQAALWCSARFQYRMARDLPRGEDGTPDLAAVPLDEAGREDLLAYLGTFDADAVDAAPPPVGRTRGVDADGILSLDGDRDRGEALWAASCAVCHGHEGEGNLGPPLAGASTPDPWTFVEYVRSGAPSSGRDGWMPHFATDRLSDRELADLAACWSE